MSNSLKYKFEFINLMKTFFNQESFLEVFTPPGVKNPGMEPHIHPFKIEKTFGGKLDYPFYLHTSPEFHMKELLSYEFKKIYTLSYCFRDEPCSPQHRNQFLMLEWYRAQERYEAIMADCENLISFLTEETQKMGIPLLRVFQNKTPIETRSIPEIFKEVLNLEILDFLDSSDLKEKIDRDFKDVPLPVDGEGLDWEDYFFLLFLNKIEPHLKNFPFLILKEYPAPLAALSTLKPTNPKVCERFEIYISGTEIANCFNELIDLKDQKIRFKEQAKTKKRLYNYELPDPEILYSSLERGLKPSSGIALGVERLFTSLTGIPGFWPTF